MSVRFELFHRIADPPSAEVRRLISELRLVEVVRYRNVGTSDEALQALMAIAPNGQVPTLVASEGQRVVSGVSAIAEVLKAAVRERER